MIFRLAVVGLGAALPLVVAASPVLAQDYKRYCILTTTPVGPQPPTVCVVDPTPGDRS